MGILNKKGIFADTEVIGGDDNFRLDIERATEKPMFFDSPL